MDYYHHVCLAMRGRELLCCAVVEGLLSRMRDLEPRLPIQRYEHAHPATCCIWTSRSWNASSNPATV
jgi:hypothetical protein